MKIIMLAMAAIAIVGCGLKRDIIWSHSIGQPMPNRPAAEHFIIRSTEDFTDTVFYMNPTDTIK